MMGVFVTDTTVPTPVALVSDQTGFVGQNLIDNSDETTVTLGSSANPSVFGATVTFTCNVAGVGPTGTVTFQVDGVIITTQALSGGVATYSTSALPVGSHLIAAFYNGDSNNAPQFATITSQTITAGSSTPVGGFRGLSRVR